MFYDGMNFTDYLKAETDIKSQEQWSALSDDEKQDYRESYKLYKETQEHLAEQE